MDKKGKTAHPDAPKIALEYNDVQGKGYKVHVIYSGFDRSFTDDALSFYDALAAANILLDCINDELGTSYGLHETLIIDAAGVDANEKTDFGSRWLKRHISAQNAEDRDFRTEIIDGKEEDVMTARGVIMTCYCAARDEDNEKCKTAVKGFCRMIAAKGYKGGASALYSELMTTKETIDGLRIIKDLYDEYNPDDYAVIGLLY